MASTIKVKRSSTASAVPSSLAEGELAANTTDGKLFLGKADTSVVEIGGGGGGYSYNSIGTVSATYGAQALESEDPVALLGTKTLTTENNYTKFWFKDDGTKLYVCEDNGTSGTYVKEYACSTAWDPSSAGSPTTFSISPYYQNAGFTMKPDGTMFWICFAAWQKVIEYTMSTAWDISTASETGSVTPTSIAGPYAMLFSPDGTKMYLSHWGRFRQYSMSTAWDVTTIDSGATGTAHNNYGYACAIYDGDFYVINTNNVVRKVSWSTQWDTTSTPTSSGTTDLSNSGNIRCYQVASNGRNFATYNSSEHLRGYNNTVSAATTQDVDWSDGSYQSLKSTTGVNITFSNVPASGNVAEMFLELEDAGAGVGVSLPSSVVGTSKVTTPTTGKTVLHLITRDGGTTVFGQILQESVPLQYELYDSFTFKDASTVEVPTDYTNYGYRIEFDFVITAAPTSGETKLEGGNYYWYGLYAGGSTVYEIGTGTNPYYVSMMMPYIHGQCKGVLFMRKSSGWMELFAEVGGGSKYGGHISAGNQGGLNNIKWNLGTGTITGSVKIYRY
jgi:hypothetical protein